MKTFLSAEDIEVVAARGQTQLILDADTVLTDLARRTAEALGVALVESKSGAGRPRPDQAFGRPAGAPAASGGRPRGCQSRPPAGSDRPAPSSAGPSNQVIDRMVQAIKSRDQKNIS